MSIGRRRSLATTGSQNSSDQVESEPIVKVIDAAIVRSRHLGHVGVVVGRIAGDVVVGEPVEMLEPEGLRQKSGRLELQKLVKICGVKTTLELIEQGWVCRRNQAQDRGARVLGVVGGDVVFPFATIAAGDFAAVEKGETPSVVLSRDEMQQRMTRGGDDLLVRLEGTIVCNE